MEKREFFPLFIRSSDYHAVVFGGGAIAARRIQTLLRFHFRITIVAPRMQEDILALAGDVNLITDLYDPKYLDGAQLVLACTDSREVNRRIQTDASQRHIWVNVCDRKEDCDFYFPGVVFGREATLGVVGSGEDHHGIKRVIDKIRKMFEGEENEN
ncbi:MAG: NAD(P)-dependent oxidoreductase [Firmicutes bacterium]|nr:NAD(P)-dependent oxidoreductase [Bacillota bacterium]